MANDARLVGTIDAIRSGLSKNGWLFRYQLDDGFGRPAVAFIICTFWLVEALARSAGRTRLELLSEARMVFEQMLGYANHLGLYSEETGPSVEALR